MATWAEDCAAAAAEIADECGETVEVVFDNGDDPLTVEAFVDRNVLRQDDHTGALVPDLSVRIARGALEAISDGDQVRVRARGQEPQLCRIRRWTETAAWWFLEVQP